MFTNIKIDKCDLNFAVDLTNDLCNEFLRKKQLYSVAILSSLSRYFQAAKVNFEIAYGLFHVKQIVNLFEFADAFVDGVYLQIAYMFDDETTVAIPKSHFDASIEPALYIVAKLNKKLDEFSIVGSINTNFLNKVDEDDRYYYIDANTLNKSEELLSDIGKLKNSKSNADVCRYELMCETNFVELIDNNLPMPDTVELIKHLISCEQCRKVVISYFKLEVLMKNNPQLSELLKEDINNNLENCLDKIPEENNNEFKLKDKSDPDSHIIDFEDIDELDLNDLLKNEVSENVNDVENTSIGELELVDFDEQNGLNDKKEPQTQQEPSATEENVSSNIDTSKEFYMKDRFENVVENIEFGIFEDINSQFDFSDGANEEIAKKFMNQQQPKFEETDNKVTDFPVFSEEYKQAQQDKEPEEPEKPNQEEPEEQSIETEYEEQQNYPNDEIPFIDEQYKSEFENEQAFSSDFISENEFEKTFDQSQGSDYMENVSEERKEDNDIERLYQEKEVDKEPITRKPSKTVLKKSNFVLKLLFCAFLIGISFGVYKFKDKLWNIIASGPTSQQEQQSIQDLPQAQENSQEVQQNVPSSSNVNKKPMHLKLSQIAFEGNENFILDPKNSKYLNILGKNIQINLQTEFLNMNDYVYNPKIRISTLISQGKADNFRIIESSGTKNVDEFILRNVKSSFEYLKPPADSNIVDRTEVVLEIAF